MAYAIIILLVIGVIAHYTIKWTNLQAKISGAIGERKVRKILKKQKDAFVINNYKIGNTDKDSGQIDHIVINPYGFFIIETKNYKGSIYGKDNWHNWKIKYNKNTKIQIANPVKQNWGHIFKLKEHITELKDFPFKNVVVLCYNNTFYVESEHTIELYNLKQTLQFGEPTLAPTRMNEIYNILLSSKTKFKNKKHIKRINKTEENIKKGICPRCGGTLTIRTSKYGTGFIGCSNYPKCKFTKSITK